jgi:anti-sigma B factor antagonist
MSVKYDVMDGVAYLAIDGDLTIFTAAACEVCISHALRDHASVSIDLSSVTNVDVAGIRLLIVVKWEAARLQRTLHFGARPPAAKEMMALFDAVITLADQVQADGDPTAADDECSPLPLGLVGGRPPGGAAPLSIKGTRQLHPAN